jgi:hypothetical protein
MLAMRRNLEENETNVGMEINFRAMGNIAIVNGCLHFFGVWGGEISKEILLNNEHYSPFNSYRAPRICREKSKVELLCEFSRKWRGLRR